MAVIATVRYFLFIILCAIAVSTRVQLRNNCYTDLTVKLPHVPEQQNKVNALVKLKELLENSSRILYSATKRRATFQVVNVLIPESWGESSSWLPDENSSFCFDNGGQESSSVDVVLTSAGDEPQTHYTLSADECGTRGERIHMTLDYLLSNESSYLKGERFVQLWSQYRYGIFPEHGFIHDSRYPQYYSVPSAENKIFVTSCTNKPITYNFKDRNGSCVPAMDPSTGRPSVDSNDCIPTPNLFPERMESSLMDSHSHARHYCDSNLSLKRSHSCESPSKHNALCSEEGAWFIILRNEDFVRGRNAAPRYRLRRKLQLQYVQESNLRIVVAVDVSSKMSKKDRYNLVMNALKKFILYDVPLGSELGLVFFTDEVKEPSRHLKIFETEKSKESFLESNLTYDEPETTNETCMQCALLHSIQMLNSDDKNGFIIMVTSNPSLDTAEETLKEELNLARVRLSVVHFTSSADDADGLELLENLASSTGGISTNVPETDPTTALSRLHLIFTQSLMATPVSTTSTVSSNAVLHFQTLPSSDDNPSLSFYFDVDEYVGNMRLLITGPNFWTPNNGAPFEETSTNLISPSGNVRIQKDLSIPAWLFRNNETGRYKFETKRKKLSRVASTSEAFAVVLGSHKRDNIALSLRAWVVFQKEYGNMPLKIFAEITKGLNPVKDAIVTVRPYNTDGEAMPAFDLVDDGLGDPDITSHDGIYSSYFVNCSGAGFYSALIMAKGGENTEIVHVAPEDCCGSLMPSSSATLTGNFTRFAFLTFPIQSSSTCHSSFPPNRILDLQLTSLNLQKMEYNLTWSSAGSDYNDGTASSYEVKLFSERTDARLNFEETGVSMKYNREIVSHTPTASYGHKQEYSIRLPNTTDSGRYYFAVRAVDESSNVGQISNLVEIFVANKMKKDVVDCSGTNTGKGGSPDSSSDPYIVSVMMLLSLAFQAFRL